MKQIIIILMTLIALSASAEKAMNVIYILADDLGWADTTLYGHTELYETPHLERLAARGMTFTNAYADSPLCSPTRASILTGQSPARHGFTLPEGHKDSVRLSASVRPAVPPGQKSKQVESVTRLNTSLPTLGKQLRAAGYQTAHFGKWHLGKEPYSPLEHGFEIDIPHWWGPGPAGGYVAPWKYPNFKANYPQEHIEDRMAEEAVAWLHSLSGVEPFFLNYWQFSVHGPFDAKASLIDRYSNKVNPQDPQRSPTYAAMVHSFDDAIGSLLDAIDTADIAGETVIIFISDNGGNMYDRVDGTSVTSNAPLRGGKATLFEGGIRVPCIVVWPGVTEPGSRSDVPIQASDFYPTLHSGLGIPLPPNHVVDAVDITEALKGGDLDRQALFTYFPHVVGVPDWLPPSITVRAGDWKLIRTFFYGENGEHQYRLYNLADDIGETVNLASSHPEVVERLNRMIDEHFVATNAVLPIPNEKFNLSRYIPENIGVPTAQQKVLGVVDGWIEGGSSLLSAGEGTAVLESTGNDPFFSLRRQQFKPIAGGPFTLKLRMMSNASGGGQLFYSHPPSKPNSVMFQPQHTDNLELISIQIPATQINGLRIDPAAGVGIIEVDSVELIDAANQTVRKWDFN